MQYIQYDPLTGKIMAHVDIPSEDTGAFERHVKAYGPLVQCDDICSVEKDYVSNHQVLPRPAMPLTINGSIISGIPKGASLKLGDQTFTVDDGEADIEGYRGTVRLSLWPYLDAEVEI